MSNPQTATLRMSEMTYVVQKDTATGKISIDMIKNTNCFGTGAPVSERFDDVVYAEVRMQATAIQLESREWGLKPSSCIEIHHSTGISKSEWTANKEAHF